MDDKPNPDPTAPARHFQFGLKHLLAGPLVLAVLFGVAAWIGLELWVPLAATGVMAFASLASLVAVTLLKRPLSPKVKGYAVAACIAAVLILYESTALQVAVERAAPRRRCADNLQQIAFALVSYHDVYGCFPPAYLADEDGRPEHSWRVLILPYLGQNDLYDQYHFAEPWDGPNNRKLADLGTPVFTCPEDSQSLSTTTNYLAVVGPHAAWLGSESTSLADFADEWDGVLHVVEVADSNIHWMEPRDLHATWIPPTVNAPRSQAISSPHLSGANAAFANGQVRFLSNNVSKEDLRAMFTRSGGEPIDIDDVTSLATD